MNATFRQPLLHRLRATAVTALLASMLPVSVQAAPAADGVAFGGDLRSDSATFFRIEQYPTRFGQLRPAFAWASAPQPLERVGLAALGALGPSLRTAGTLLHSAFIDALDPTIGLARPVLLGDAAASGPERSALLAPGGAQDADIRSSFRVMDSQRRAATPFAPVLGVRLGERSSLRLQMGGMDTREEDGFAGGLRFEYVR